MNDKQLIMLLYNNPQEGLAIAIDLYGGTVKWITQKIIGNTRAQDVEECVSDTFLKLWQSLERFQIDKGVSLKSYLYGIARHTALDRNRKNESQQETIPIEENNLELYLDFADDMARAENVRLLQEAVESLPEPDRKIFILRYFLQEKIIAIAESLSLSPKTVENKLYRGKKILKEALIERGVMI